VETLPQISWLETCPEYDAQGHLIGARYRNAAGIQIAAFDVVEKFHNNQVTWQWAQMTRAEKDFALRWIFDPQQMHYEFSGSRKLGYSKHNSLDSAHQCLRRSVGSPGRRALASRWTADERSHVV
jgi:hypothetical protein